MTRASPANIHALHAGIAESGKLLALKGRHEQALARYREALRMAQAVRAPQLFARHYLHCILESLEHLGAFEAAARLAAEAARAIEGQQPTPFQCRDRAMLLERQGVNQLKAGQLEPARENLQRARALDATLALSQQLLGWLDRGLTVNRARIAEAQRRHGYFVVRPETVRAGRAITSPPDSSLSPLPQEACHG